MDASELHSISERGGGGGWGFLLPNCWLLALFFSRFKPFFCGILV